MKPEKIQSLGFLGRTVCDALGIETRYDKTAGQTVAVNMATEQAITLANAFNEVLAEKITSWLRSVDLSRDKATPLVEVASRHGVILRTNNLPDGVGLKSPTYVLDWGRNGKRPVYLVKDKDVVALAKGTFFGRESNFVIIKTLNIEALDHLPMSPSQTARLIAECAHIAHQLQSQSNLVIITRHPALVEYLREIGFLKGDVVVLDHASPGDVEGKDVIGVLPHSLSCLTRTFTEVPLRLTPELRGKELTIETLREIASDPVTYRVERVK